MKDVTFIVQTFKRPECIKRLLRSIKKFYPKQEVIVYDDSDFDKGLSWGRNYLVSQVKTPYYLLLDDDFEFIINTKIELLLDKIKQGYDIIGGSLLEDGVVRHYEGRYELKNKRLKYIQSTEEPLDFVFNFFLAKQKVSGWDERLKLAEHTAWFLSNKGKWKIGYIQRCQIAHKPIREKDYLKYRNRAWKYFDDYMIWNNIKTTINFDKVIYKLGDYKKYNKKYEDSIK